MRINQNISAMNTHASMLKADNGISKSLERLSSGLRINRAADDAAGLAISEKMRGQIRGLQQATRNAQDGISLLQTAEGNLNETHSILQRMRELAVQASNGTVTDADRAEIQKEMDQLTQETDRIAKDTEFNTMKLLRGTAAGVTVSGANMTGGAAAVPVAATATLDFSALSATDFDSGAVVTVGALTLTEGADFNVGADFNASLDDLADAITNAGGSLYNATRSGETIVLTAKAAGAGGNAAGLDFEVDGSANDIAATTFNMTGGGPGAATPSTGSITINRQLEVGNTITVGATQYTMVANGGPVGANQIELGTDLQGTIDNIVAELTNGTLTATDAGNGRINLSDSAGNNLALATNVSGSNSLSLTMQIGANAGQSMNILINNMDAGSLGVGRMNDGSAAVAGTDADQGLDVSSATAANASITAIDAAITRVSQERSRLGAYQNRLDHTISNLSAASENLSASESRVRDVDMAAEMANFSKAQILMQASTSMMAQANQKPQAVLKLLG